MGSRTAPVAELLTVLFQYVAVVWPHRCLSVRFNEGLAPILQMKKLRLGVSMLCRRACSQAVGGKMLALDSECAHTCSLKN